MRTRTHSTDLNTQTVDSWQTHTDVLGVETEVLRWHWPGYSLPNAETHSILDERPQFKRYGNVSHVVTALVALPCAGSNSRTYGYPTASTYTYYYDEYALFNRAIRAPGASSSLMYDPGVILDNWESLSIDAVKAMTPSFNERNSLVNFVLELKDLKRIPDLWKAKSGGKPLAYSWSAIGRRLAEAHLNYEFGIAPLISDITSMVSGMRGFQKKLRDLQAGIGKTQTRHYSCRVPFQSLRPELTIYQEGGGVYKVISRSSWNQIPQYHASMRFKYSLPDMSLIGNQIKALLDTLGVRLDGTIIWNAISYSFIVDWFVKVGKFLGALSVDNLQVPIVIEDFCHSIKSSVLNELCDSDYGTFHIVAQRTVSSYERRRTIPHSNIPSLHSGDAGWQQAALGLSLFTVNYSSPKGTKGFRHG